MIKKKNYKLILGVIVGVLISATVVGAATYYGSADSLTYDNTDSDLSSSNVQEALDELYNRTYCPSGYVCYVPLSSQVSVGDYVSYTPSKTSYTIDQEMTGYTSSTQTINPSELNLWRVLNINEEKGTVDLISEYVSSTAVYFRGQTGYLNFVGYLNTLAKQYETEGITEGSRYFGYNGQTEYITDTSMFTSTPPFGCSTDGTKGNCSNTTYPYDPDNYEEYGGGDTLYTTDYEQLNTALGTRVAYKVGTSTATAYWMASRFYTYNGTTYFRWYGRYVDTSGSNKNTNLYIYNAGSFSTNSSRYALRPIVTLSSTLQVEGLGTEYSPMKIITS